MNLKSASPKHIIPNGYLIAFEGIDGSGKTTAARLTTERLRQEGFIAQYLREPTDGPHGSRLREIMVSPEKRDPQLEFELFVLDRMDDVEHNILPVMRAGGVVCIDRYYISSMAYQGALGVDVDMIQSENEKFAPQPNLILRFDVDIDTALTRIHSTRSAGANQFEKRDYLELVNAQFNRMTFPQMVNIPSGEGKEAVFNRTWEIVIGKLEAAIGQNLAIPR